MNCSFKPQTFVNLNAVLTRNGDNYAQQKREIDINFVRFETKYEAFLLALSKLNALTIEHAWHPSPKKKKEKKRKTSVSFAGLLKT